MASKLFATLFLVTIVTFGKIYPHLLLCNSLFHMQTVTSQNNGSTANLITCPQLEILRGRDGRDGRDGMPGATGPQGPPGPRSGGVTYVRWGRAPALMWLALNYSMLGELEETTFADKEVVATICACLKFLSISYDTHQDHRVTVNYLELNMNTPLLELTTTMYPVLCALLQPV